MFHPDSTDPNRLKTVLEPLSEDFQYWFTRSHAVLENQEISFLGDEKQANLLERVLQAHQEVNTTLALLKVTDGQIGVQPFIVATWHQIVEECWQTSRRLCLEKSV